MSENDHQDLPADGASAWSAAPAPTATTEAPRATDAPRTTEHDAADRAVPGQYAAPGQYGQQPYRAEPNGWYGQAGAPVGPTAWYGGAAPAGQRAGKPRPPWFWPVVAIVVGVAALLVGGGAGFAIGHTIGEHQSQSSTSQFPGQGSNGFPGGTNGGSSGSTSGGTTQNQIPGQSS